MFSRRADHSHKEEEQIDDDIYERSASWVSERDTKRSLMTAILFCLFVLLWIGLQPVPDHPQTIYVWTEENTKHGKIESYFPPSEETIVLPFLSFDPAVMKSFDKEWINAMKHSPITGIDFEFNKGFSDKYRVVFESGHVAVAKPIVSAEEMEAGLFQQLKTIDYNSIPVKKRSGKRTGLVDVRLIQGWSEVAAFHVDRILEFYMKPPIVARQFDNHFWFAHDSSVRSLRYRNAETFEYPMALVAWLDHVKSATPDWETVGKVLVQAKSVERKFIELLKSTSDTILFDFLIDDHDKHNVQNWKQWKHLNQSHPLVWDSGLGWTHGPDGYDSSCTNLLCGPKEWREIEEGWNDSDCRPICRFNSKTIQKLRNMESNVEPSLGEQLENSLQREEIYPVFQYGEYQAAPKSKAITNIVHFTAENFFEGMNEKSRKLLKHVDECIHSYGEDNVLL